jgi:DNA-binding response OmpR family regulator
MRKKILVIDDDSDILEILGLLLTGEGYEIRTLIHGDFVFESIKDFQPDLILLDVMLADMDGRTICKDIKKNKLTYSIPVILISGTHDLKHLLNLPGAPNDFIAKPFDIAILLDGIEKQLVA